MLERCILENYIPLLRSGIHKVELDTKHMVNLLISPSGVGKSSILKELNPLPPENGNYESGRKYTEWKIGAKHYVLDSYTGLGNGHSFKLNGKELNTGGTFSAQKELCWNHFRLDSNAVKVCNGIRITDRISSMSTNRRKEILMQVYPNDTEYAMNVYSKLRVERNELKAAIKNQVARYAEENRKLSYINEQGIDKLEEHVKQLESELKKALLVRGSLEGIKADPELESKITQFNQLTDQLTVNKLSGLFNTENELIKQIGVTESVLARHQEQASIIQGIINENAACLEGLEEFLKDPDSFKEQTKQIKTEIAELNNRIQNIDDILAGFPVFGDETNSFDNLHSVAKELYDYLGRVTVASTPEMSGGLYKSYMTKHEQTITDIREKKLTLADLQHKLKHYNSAETVDCPDCKTKFKVGITKQDIDSTARQVDVLTETITKLTKQNEELGKLIENDAEWFNSMNQLYRFIRENGHVKILGELVKEFEVGKVYSTTLQNALEHFVNKVNLISHRDVLGKEESLLDARLDMLDRNNVLDVANYVASLERELSVETNKISFYKKRLIRENEQLSQIQNYNSNLNKLEVLRKQIFDGLENKSKVIFRGSVDRRISEITSEKEEQLSAIIKSRSLTAVVISIEDDIERLKKRLNIVETLADGLCPNKGLIGKYMSDFIKSICGNMNFVIQKVWNTTLYILPCAKSNGDLTYKFPVASGDGAPAPDISDCSAGQTDIIDWAFRFVLMDYFQFPLPLIMDEVGPFFDEIKRGRFFNFMQEYTQRKDAKQLFLVSHYLGDRNLFKDANFVGLKYEGLSLPGEMNKHTVVI